MRDTGIWGTDVDIFSASSLLSTDIFVYTKVGNSKKWLLFSKRMLDASLPENACAIYIEHVNGVHYDVVLDVDIAIEDHKTDTVEAKADCSTNRLKRKLSTTPLVEELLNVRTCQTEIDENETSYSKHHFENKMELDSELSVATNTYSVMNNEIHLAKNMKAERKRKQNEENKASKRNDSIHVDYKKAKINVPICQEQDLQSSLKYVTGKDASKNTAKFHKSIHYSIVQCKVCLEAWPLKTKPKSLAS